MLACQANLRYRILKTAAGTNILKGAKRNHKARFFKVFFQLISVIQFHAKVLENMV